MGGGLLLGTGLFARDFTVMPDSAAFDEDSLSFLRAKEEEEEEPASARSLALGRRLASRAIMLGWAAFKEEQLTSGSLPREPEEGTSLGGDPTGSQRKSHSTNPKKKR